jgi:hypothetical protein
MASRKERLMNNIVPLHRGVRSMLGSEIAAAKGEAPEVVEQYRRFEGDIEPPEPFLWSDIFGRKREPRFYTGDEVWFAFFLGGFVCTLIICTTAIVLAGVL